MKKKTSGATETNNKVKIDFTGKIIFVGIDVHEKTYYTALLCEGVILSQFTTNSNGEELIAALNKKNPGATFKCVYESCAWGFNLQRKLTAAGMDCIVVHAADIPGTDKEKQNKTDKVDATKLARSLAGGFLRGIHIPDQQLEKERSLVRHRKNIQGDLNRSRNRLKSLLKVHGIGIPENFQKCNWSNNFLLWIDDHAKADVILQPVLESMVRYVRMQRQELLMVEKAIRKLMCSEKFEVKSTTLQTTPGIGPIISSVLLVELGDIKRFKGFDPLNCVVGFYPKSHNSGDKVIQGKISNRRHNLLRSMLIEAAWQSIRIDPAMLDAYEKLKKRMTGNRAIIRIARKLLRRIYRVMRTGEQYELGIVA